MPAKINPSDIKLATKLAAQIKDLPASAVKKYPWAGLYLISSVDGGMIFYATDGATWFTWNFNLEEPTESNYDFITSTDRMNDFASKAKEGTSYEVMCEDGHLLFMRGNERTFIQPEAVSISYPSPKQQVGLSLEEQTFIANAAILSNNFKFVIPFVDSGNPTAARTVATWSPDGTLMAGSIQKAVIVSGMPSPPLAMSFKQKPLKALVAFLSSLEGDVSITLTGNRYIFKCQVRGHVLDISAESVYFPKAYLDMGDQVPDIIKFDGKALMDGTGVINAVLPSEIDRLSVSISGSRQNSKIGISAVGGGKNSSNAYPIIRENENGESSNDINFIVNCRIFESVLSHMNGVILEGRCYMQGDKKKFGIEDERSTEDDTFRCVFLPVTVSGGADLTDEEKDPEELSQGKKKPSMSKS